MSRYSDLEIKSGPYVVLSDGSLFDDAFDCEVVYMSKQAEEEVLDIQNRGWSLGDGPGTHFDAAEPDQVYSIPLRDIIRFYFDKHPNEDPMR